MEEILHPAIADEDVTQSEAEDDSASEEEKPLCDICCDNGYAEIRMEYADLEEGVGARGLVSQELCYSCSACVLLKIPHLVEMAPNPQNIRKRGVARTPNREEHPEVETFRPLKRRRLSERFSNELCTVCKKYLVAISFDLLKCADNQSVQHEACWKCSAKLSLELEVGLYKFTDNDTAILQIV